MKHIVEGVLVTDGLPASREKTIGSVSLSLSIALSLFLSLTHTNVYASCIAALQFGFASSAFGGLSVCEFGFASAAFGGLSVCMN